MLSYSSKEPRLTLCPRRSRRHSMAFLCPPSLAASGEPMAIPAFPHAIGTFQLLPRLASQSFPDLLRSPSPTHFAVLPRLTSQSFPDSLRSPSPTHFAVLPRLTSQSFPDSLRSPSPTHFAVLPRLTSQSFPDSLRSRALVIAQRKAGVTTLTPGKRTFVHISRRLCPRSPTP